jgi:hypothetical protein
MTWFADLSECTYFGRACARHLRAVGWLERGKPFPRGMPFLGALANRDVLRKLSKLLENPWQLVPLRGWHTCDFCFLPRRGTRSISNLFVPGQGTIYVCPELILHYIRRHGYVPPAEFTRAVLECPPMRSDAYFDALTAQGGQAVIDGSCFKESVDRKTGVLLT